MPRTSPHAAMRTASVVALAALSMFHFGRAAWRSVARGVVDFPIFLAEARAFLETGVLYPYLDRPELYAPAAPVYKFPPLFATLLLPFAEAPAGQVVLGHWLLQLAVYLGTGMWLLAVVRETAGARGALVLAAIWLNAAPFFETLWRLQLETYILLALVGALAALRADDDARAGFAVGAAATLKVYPALMLAPWLVARRWRGLVGAGAAGLLLTAATLLVIGVAEHRRWVVGVLPLMLGEPPLDDPENVSIAAAAMRGAGLGASAAGLLQRVVALPAVAVAAWLAATRGARRASPAARRLALALFVPTTLLAMPNAWGHYQLLLLVPLVLVLVERPLDGGPSRRPETWLAWLAVATLLVAIPCPREMIGQWPCAETPPLLGVAPLPRSLHDALTAGRMLATPLTWIAAALALRRGAVTRGAYGAA